MGVNRTVHSPNRAVTRLFPPASVCDASDSTNTLQRVVLMDDNVFEVQIRGDQFGDAPFIVQAANERLLIEKKQAIFLAGGMLLLQSRMVPAE